MTAASGYETTARGFAVAAKKEDSMSQEVARLAKRRHLTLIHDDETGEWIFPYDQPFSWTDIAGLAVWLELLSYREMEKAVDDDE